MKPVVYIAHPYGGNPENLTRAKAFVRFAYEQGYAPAATWIIGCELFAEGAVERERGLQADEESVKRADELWLCGDRISEGMMREHAAFDWRGPVRRFVMVDGQIMERFSPARVA
jgi:hypothetical protein